MTISLETVLDVTASFGPFLHVPCKQLVACPSEQASAVALALREATGAATRTIHLCSEQGRAFVVLLESERIAEMTGQFERDCAHAFGYTLFAA